MSGAERRGAARPTRERDRYRRASWREQLGDGLRAWARNPRALLLVAILLGGWVFLQLTSPRLVQLEDLRVGTCLHVPTSSNGNIAVTGQVGTPDEVAAVLAGSGANAAACDASHSHEVAAVFADPEPAGTAYPRFATLQQRHAAACDAAFASYVGRPVAGSALQVTVVVQSQAGWDAGRRAGACLVSRADGGFLTSGAVGSAQ
ncbi:MAG TPA: septum formation family protein [Candidatus Limnocylindrales bacterium]